MFALVLHVLRLGYMFFAFPILVFILYIVCSFPALVFNVSHFFISDFGVHYFYTVYIVLLFTCFSFPILMSIFTCFLHVVCFPMVFLDVLLISLAFLWFL